MSEIILCPSCHAKNRVKPHNSGRAICGRCKTPLPSVQIGETVELNDSNFQSYISSSNRPVLVDFWADWCGPCKMMAPVLKQLAEKQGKIVIAKLNTEQSPLTSARFRIQSIPTLVLFNGGQEIDRFSGAMPLNALENRLAHWLE